MSAVSEPEKNADINSSRNIMPIGINKVGSRLAMVCFAGLAAGFLLEECGDVAKV